MPWTVGSFSPARLFLFLQFFATTPPLFISLAIVLSVLPFTNWHNEGTMALFEKSDLGDLKDLLNDDEVGKQVQNLVHDLLERLDATQKTRRKKKVEQVLKWKKWVIADIGHKELELNRTKMDAYKCQLESEAAVNEEM